LSRRSLADAVARFDATGGNARRERSVKGFTTDAESPTWTDAVATFWIGS
jgi:hypothetical protein